MYKVMKVKRERTGKRQRERERENTNFYICSSIIKVTSRCSIISAKAIYYFF